MKPIRIVFATIIAASGCTTTTEVQEIRMIEKSRGEVCLPGEPAEAFKPSFKEQVRVLAKQACNKEKFVAFRFADAQRQIVMNGKSYMCGTFDCEN